MTVHNLTQDILYVIISTDKKISEQLKTINELFTEKKKDCDVIIDFSTIQLINSANISNLLILHKLLTDNSRRLIFCHVSFLVKSIFTVTGVSDAFTIVPDKKTALEILRSS